MPLDEEYIVTPDDEVEIWANALEQKRKDVQFELWNKGKSKDQILLEMSQINFESLIDKESLFKTCNSNKHQALWHKEQAQKRLDEDRQKRDDLVRKCNANYFRNLMYFNCKGLGKEFIYNEQTKPLIKVICYFMAKDERFETELGYDLKKGLWLQGTVGLGKTFLFQLIKNNELSPLNIESMIDIAENVKNEGKHNLKGIFNVLDDIGSEQHEINHYGTKINWLKEYLESRYTASKIYNNLIISTNADFNQIEQLYGFRLRSRCREMFNIISITGKDLRK